MENWGLYFTFQLEGGTVITFIPVAVPMPSTVTSCADASLGS